MRPVPDALSEQTAISDASLYTLVVLSKIARRFRSGAENTPCRSSVSSPVESPFEFVMVYLSCPLFSYTVQSNVYKFVVTLVETEGFPDILNVLDAGDCCNIVDVDLGLAVVDLRPLPEGADGLVLV